MFDQKILLIFLILISFSQTLLTEEDENYKQFEIGSKVPFSKHQRYFKFDYSGNNNLKALFYFPEVSVGFYLLDGNKNRMKIDHEYNRNGYSYIYQMNLTYNGTYYIELESESGFLWEIGSSFSSYIPGKIIEIDFSKSYYYSEIDFYSNIYYGFIEYKIKNLKETKYVFFQKQDIYRDYYIPYYPDEEFPICKPYYPYYETCDDYTLFEICEGNSCNKSIQLFYEFKPGKEYTIKIHPFRSAEQHHYDELEYKYNEYIFIPFTVNNLKNIGSKTGAYSCEEPTIYLIEPNKDKDIHIYTSGIDFKYFSRSEKKISEIEDLYYLQFQTYSSYFDIYSNETYYFIGIVFSKDLKFKLYVLDEMDKYSNETSFIIPKNTNKIVQGFESDDMIKGYNNLIVVTSENKNMKYINSLNDEKTNLIIQNFRNFPIYFDEIDKDNEINITYYNPKYAFFGASNPYFFDTLYSYLSLSAAESGIDINNYLKVTQMNLRINTNYLPWFEFYNFYVQQLELQLNVYIKQIFGKSEIFECNADSLDFNDLTILTRPITKEKCQNKKNVINRLFSFDGTKIISGYLGPDSYFDIYAEINNDNTNIDISPIMLKDIQMTNTAKYLRKGIEYKLNFFADHLVKLEPGFNAEIIITNGQSTTTINSQYPTATISGNGLTIKSDIDAMVYFFGKLPERSFIQKKIKNEKGKIAKISNIRDDVIIIDFGFEGYFPSTIPLEKVIREEGVIFLDNWYEKLQTKLVKDEYLYVYISSKNEPINLKIEYLDNNLNNANNEFNILLSPKNDGENQEANDIIIDNLDFQYMVYDFHFCKPNTNVEIMHYGKSEQRYFNFTDETYKTDFDHDINTLRISRGDNLLSCRSNQPIVFSYSLFDVIDEDIYEGYQFNDWREERKVLNDSSIIVVETKDKDNNIINIKFEPNYKYSSTRYIIIIAPATDEHKNNFDDPCHITKLLNERPKDVVVDKTYSIGDEDTIIAEVDISKIINDNNNYIVNIISQELRFSKKINFYQPISFTFEGIKPEPDTSDNPTDIPSEDEDYIKIELGSDVEYNKNRKKFRFDYNGNNNITAYFIFKMEVRFSWIDENENIYDVQREKGYSGRIDDVYAINLTYNGTYYIEIECYSGPVCDIGSQFVSFVPGKIIKNIDLSESFYNSDIDFIVKQYYDTGVYEVNPTEDKLVFFASSIFNDINSYSYPFYNSLHAQYPDDTDEYSDDENPADSDEPHKSDEHKPDPDYDDESDKKDEESSSSLIETGYDISGSNETIFEICNETDCEKNVRFYQFKKGIKYKILIHFIKIDFHNYYDDYYGNSDYRYIKYFFIPISNNMIINVKDNNGFYLTDKPKLYVISPNQNKDINIWSELVGFGYYAMSNEPFTDITKVKYLEFKKAPGNNNIPKGLDQYIIIFAFSLKYKSPIIFANDNERYLNETLIPADTSKYFERFFTDEKKYLSNYNYMPVYTSQEKNMMYASSEKPDEKVNTIFQNYNLFPIFLEKLKEDYELNIKTYKPKYAFFGATDPYFFETAFSYLKLITTRFNLNIDNYHQMTQMNLRINSKYLPWYEFYNFYLKELNLGLNIYIKQLFGTSEIYECNADSLDFNDLSILTTPISNVKCKNKKSIFNRLFKLDGTKILSGYIGPDSYFDIYAEFENDNKNIDISPIMKKELYMKNGAKYLKKNVEYTLNFFAEHLVKLEPKFNAEITITNGQTTVKIDPKHPTAPISGKEFKIKSNNDAMVYFIGKLDNGISQLKINNEKGKILKISNIDEDHIEFFVIDFGFEGYYPLTLIQMRAGIREDGTIYIDNWYDKLKETLVEGESLYIYYSAGREPSYKIEYLNKNINNANNEFNIFLIPKTNEQEENALIIDTGEVRKGYFDVHFCHDNTNIKLNYDGHIFNYNNDDYYNYNKYRKEHGPIQISRGSNLISCTTDQPFVFSYSGYDMTDEEFEHFGWENETKTLDNLIITEAKGKDNEDNIISIKFTPNYVNSSTRYIILIAPKDAQIAIDDFNNPCYITDLLNKRPKGVLIDKIYSIGDKDLITAEVDISSILSGNNNYVVTIISQELRFEKRINFYPSLEFKYDSDSSNDKDQTTLVLAIVLPIIGAILIVVGIILFLRYKRKNAMNSKEEIEKLTSEQLTNI